MFIGFFDLETTGLPTTINFNTYYDPSITKYYNSSRVVQMALIVYEVIPDEKQQIEYKMISEHDYIIKPDGFTINNDHIHHITNELANFAGIPFADAIGLLKADFLKCDWYIAHNIIFDKNVLLSELHRYQITDLIAKMKSSNIFCTSRDCRAVTQLKYKTGSFKQPKLIELHKFLFETDPGELHNALADTRVLAACFFEMLKKQLVVYQNDKFVVNDVTG